METENNKTLLNYALRWGAIMGLCVLIAQLLVYLIAKEGLVSFWFGSLMLVGQIAFIVITVFIYRKQQTNGLLSFKDGFMVGITVYAGSLFISSVFQYILYNIIDPDLSNYIYERTVEMTTNMLEKFGGSEEDLEKALSKINPEDLKLTPARLVSNYFMSLFFGAIISVIIAAILRKKPQIDQIA